MEKRNTNWYVARRGELLAEQFLLDLQPDNVSANRSENEIMADQALTAA